MNVSSQHNDRMGTWSARAMVLVGVMVAALAAMTSGAHASEHTFDRGFAAACTQYAQQLDRFPDVAADATHAAAIDCLSHWEVVQGRATAAGERAYAPGDDVSRAAMATFIAGTLQRLPAVETPAPDDELFDDYTSGTHFENVHMLRAADIVQGRADGTYGPQRPVTRAAMASYIARLIEFVTDDQITVGDEFDPAFPDTSGVHADNIDKLATLGIVAGRTDGTYGPSEPVTRAAMASIIARTMDYLAFRGYLPVPFQVDIEASADEAPTNLNQRITGVVEDQFGTGFFGAEIRFEVYRDDALVLTADGISGLGGDIELRYNADANQGETDRVVACVVSAAESAEDDVPYCLAGDDLEPVDNRRATELTFGWGEPAVASTAPDEGEFYGMAITINPADNTLGFQNLPTPDAPGDVPLGEFYVFEYVDEANFQVGDQVNVATSVFECAVEASIADQRDQHLLHISRGADAWNTYALSTSTDLSGCF